MRRRRGVFEGGSPAPRLDAARLMQRPIAWLTPNRLVAICRVVLVALLVVALAVGPEGFDSPGPRFAVAYALTLVALPAWPQFGGRDIAAGIAMLLGARWAFGLLDGGTPAMLLTQLAGIACAIVPIHARNVGGLAGATEGHISFTERRAMWHRAAAAPARRAAPAAAAAPATQADAVGLLDYRPEAGA